MNKKRRAIAGTISSIATRLARPLLALAIASFAVAPTLAEARSPYCVTSPAGKPRIPKTGTCPTGYFSSGPCCEAYHSDAKPSVPKITGRACPSGWRASGGSCQKI